MYKVIHFFTDLQDNDHPYNVGDTFPRGGADVTEERIAELAGAGNKQGTPLIKQVAEKKAKKPAKSKKAEPETEE